MKPLALQNGMNLDELARPARAIVAKNVVRKFLREDAKPHLQNELLEKPMDHLAKELNPRPQKAPPNLLESRFARKISTFASLSPEDLDAITDLYRRRRKFPAGRDIIRQGQTAQTAFILEEGWAGSYKILANGSRHVVGIHIAGDFLGLRSLLFRAADHSVETITAVRASEVSQSFLTQTFAEAPRFRNGILWAASRDEAIVAENMVSVGRRSAGERLAHFLLELAARLRLIGLGDSAGYACPLTQYILADALGLSAVQVNRSLRELREERLVTFQQGQVVFQDFQKLVAFADFDQTYLDQEISVL